MYKYSVYSYTLPPCSFREVPSHKNTIRPRITCHIQHQSMFYVRGTYMHLNMKSRIQMLITSHKFNTLDIMCRQTITFDNIDFTNCCYRTQARDRNINRACSRHSFHAFIANRGASTTGALTFPVCGRLTPVSCSSFM